MAIGCASAVCPLGALFRETDGGRGARWLGNEAAPCGVGSPVPCGVGSPVPGRSRVLCELLLLIGCDS